MGNTQVPARPDFHATVQFEMSRRGWGVRTLAKALAGPRPSIEQIELERRAVRRWLKGARPSRTNRRRVAVALGLPEATFDDEDEEADSLPAFLSREVERAARRWQRRQAPQTPEPAASMRRRRPAPTAKEPTP